MTYDTYQERELKLKLPDRLSFEKLNIALGQPEKVIRQINTYFDTPDGQLRRRAQVMVRVRQCADSVELTVKDRIHLDEQQASQSVRERTTPLELAQWQDVQAGRQGVCDLQNALCRELKADFDVLTPFAVTENTRRVYALADGYLAEVDETEFPNGRIDHEVEVELRQADHSFEGARAALTSGLEEDLVAVLEPSTPKYMRLLAVLSLAADED